MSSTTRKTRNDRKPHQLPSGNWNMRVLVGYDVNGKRILKSLTAPTQGEVMMMAEKFEAGLLEEKERITVKQAMDNYVADNEATLKPSTVNTYKGIAKNRFVRIHKRNIYELTARDIQQALKADTAGNKKKQTALAYLRTCLRVYGVEVKGKIKVPAVSVEEKELPRIDQLLTMVKDTKAELPVLLSLFCGGMRISEIRGLKYSDISTVNGELYIDICRARVCSDGKDFTGDPKTLTSKRRVPLPAYVYDLIMAQAHNSSDDWIIRVCTRTLNNWLKDAVLPHNFSITFHDLRRVFATQMLLDGTPKEVIEATGGWSNSVVLSRCYLKISKEVTSKNLSRFTDKYLTESNSI